MSQPVRDLFRIRLQLTETALFKRLVIFHANRHQWVVLYELLYIERCRRYLMLYEVLTIVNLTLPRTAASTNSLSGLVGIYKSSPKEWKMPELGSPEGFPGMLTCRMNHLTTVLVSKLVKLWRQISLKLRRFIVDPFYVFFADVFFYIGVNLFKVTQTRGFLAMIVFGCDKYGFVFRMCT